MTLSFPNAPEGQTLFATSAIFIRAGGQICHTVGWCFAAAANQAAAKHELLARKNDPTIAHSPLASVAAEAIHGPASDAGCVPMNHEC